MNKGKNSPNNIVDLDRRRARKQTPTAQLLKDSKKISEAVSKRTCVICNAQKACVNKTGVCSYCFENELTPEEKHIAREEASHKTIQIQVSDDRW